MTTCNSTLDVQYVGDNKGNSGNKKQYEFKYVPDILDFKPIDTGIKISLSANTSKDITIIGYKISDATDIIVNDTIGKREICIPGEYEKGALYLLSVFVNDSSKGNKFNCDPQVRNSKPPV
jgi:hypothetical protein